jgi:Putative peptidoglycan binding domain
MVMTEVRAQVNEETNRGQLPWGNTNLIGSVYLNSSPAPAASPNADNTTTSNPAELEFWRSVKDSDNPAQLKAYLTRYPDGLFRPLAQGRIASLEGTPNRTTRGAATGVVDPATYQKRADKASEDELALGKSRRRDVQRRLTDLGFDTKENGKFDDSTRATIKRWQAVRGYPVTGYLNKLQQQALEKEGSSQPVDDKTVSPDQGKNSGSTAQQPPESTPPPEPELPDFPSWPPPMPSASYVLPDKLLERYHTLKEATDAILTALETTGYVERSFFRTEPGGIALVTRLERIEADGSPAHPGRWASAESTYPSAQDLINFLRGLFFVKKGHYRLIIFVIQETPFVLSQKSMPEPEARALIGKGANTLPMATAKRSFKDNHCTALIYEFSSDGKSVEFLAESPLTGKQHLDKAGVLSLLAKPR